jgi:hypothetical protein
VLIHGKEVCCEAPEYAADHDKPYEYSSGSEMVFEVTSRAAVAADPGECPLDNPSSRTAGHADACCCVSDRITVRR